MITDINNKDKSFLMMLYCCGVITEYGLELMNISNYKLKSYEDRGLIEKVYENRTAGYKLTAKAKKLIYKRYGLKRSYTYRSIRYCSKLQEIYLNINFKKYEWKTENEAKDLLEIKPIQNDLNNRNGNVSAVDAIIVDRETGTMFGIEIVSSSYREIDLYRKEQFLKLLKIEAIFIEC